jgi:epsilon-lactone hydrolase
MNLCNEHFWDWHLHQIEEAGALRREELASRKALYLAILSLTAAAAFAHWALISVVAAQDSIDSQPYVSIPDTISSEAAQYLRSLPGPAARPPAPTSDDTEAWKAAWQVREDQRIPLAEAAVQKYGPTIVERKLGNVSVLEIKPKGWQDHGKLIVYMHGGAYTFLSARSSLDVSVIAADATGLRVISIDYTVAPQGKWQQVTDEVLSVVAALRTEGTALKDIAFFGDSAGGGLAAGAVLKMRDRGLGMPAAVVLWSPWADITNRGDTAVTLRDAEPTYLYDVHLGPAADAYTPRADQRNPYVSPVYGDFTPGFPPTLIQGGTKEIFLSHFVRLYQAIGQAGGTVKLDLYEGMPHVFQTRLAEAPEGRAALKKMAAFLRQHLTD